MDKNLFLAVTLSILVYVGWFAWIERKMPIRPPQAPAAVAVSAPEKTGIGQEKAVLAQAPEPAQSASVERTVALDAAHGLVTFTTLGAGISSFKFHGPLGPVELVPSAGRPFFSTPVNADFQLVSQAAREVVFEGALPNGLRLKKTFTLSAEGAWNELKLEAENPGKTPLTLEAWPINLGPGLGTVASEKKENLSNLRILAHDPRRKKARKVKAGADAGAWDWIGIDNRYFLAALRRPEGGVAAQAAEEKGEGGQVPVLRLASGPINVPAGGRVAVAIPFYFGAKDYDRLKSLGFGLETSVDFGFFAAIGKAILLSLKALHRLTGNYGWSILILTLAIQTLLLPLSLKSLKANAAMKKLQPQIQKIQEKFKNDPQRMNVEMMQLYKTSGTNPLGGCLPMLAQIPVFFALFTALRNAWELHGSPWIMWIKDLSAHDPYYVLPIVMGALMFFQQKSQPQVGDPAQAKMMQFMPIVFTFMFLNFPSGLVLYWLTNSVVSLAQQVLLQPRLQ